MKYPFNRERYLQLLKKKVLTQEEYSEIRCYRIRVSDQLKYIDKVKFFTLISDVITKKLEILEFQVDFVSLDHSYDDKVIELENDLNKIENFPINLEITDGEFSQIIFDIMDLSMGRIDRP